MAMLYRVIWGAHNPFNDKRLVGLDKKVQAIRKKPWRPGVEGATIYENDPKRGQPLPTKPYGYYMEYDLTTPEPGSTRDALRLVLGQGGEVYVTGSHYGDFRQIINMPW